MIDGTKTPQLTYEWSDQLSRTRGHHTIRAGYEQQHVIWNICSCGKIRGGLTFQTWADFLPGESATQNGTANSNVFTSNAAMQLWSTPMPFGRIRAAFLCRMILSSIRA